MRQTQTFGSESAILSTANKWAAVSVLMMGTALAILSTSTVGVAVSRMQSAFSVSIDTMTWVLIAYNIALIITASLSGWLGSLLGRKQVYVLSLMIFTGASLWCGLSASFEVMLVGRVVQGLGAGALAPIGNALVFSMFTGPDRARVMGVFLMAPAAAAGLGPVLGGWLTDTFDWRWVFFFTVPLAASLAFLCARLLPGTLQEKRMLVHIDVVGIILLVLSLTTLQLFLLRGPRDGWFESPLIITVSLVALISLLTFIVWEWQISEPVLNLRVLSNPSCMAGISLVLLWGLVFYANPFLLPLYLQRLRDYSVLDSGLILLPQGLTMILISPIIGRLYEPFGARVLAASGILLLIAGYIDMAHFTLEVSTLRMLPAFVLTGAGVACLNPVLATATVSTLPTSHIGDATSLYALMRWIGGNMGFALVGTQVIHRTAVHEQALTSYTTLEAIGVTSGLRNLTDYFTNQGLSLPMTEVYAMKFMHQIVDSQASMLAYRDIFAMLALLFLCGSPLIWLLGRHRRDKQATI